MPKISRSDSNLFPIPRGSYIRNTRYVYVNTSNRYVPPSEKKEKGGRGKGTTTVELETFVVTGYDDDEAMDNRWGLYR